MSSKSVNLGYKKIKKIDSYKNKKAADVNKILISKEEPYGTKSSFKYFIRQNDNDVIRPLCIKLSQMTAYVRAFESNTTISFKINNKQLLKKYNQKWKRVEKLLKIEFDSKPIYGDDNKYIKTKIIMYSDSMFTSFQGKKIPKEKAPCKCLSIIMLDFVIKANKKYYPQTLLEEYKYEQEKIKMENLIDDDLKKSLSDESDRKSYNDSNDEYNE